MKYIFAIALIFLSSCQLNNNYLNNCTKEYAKLLTDDKVKRLGDDLNELNVAIYEDSENFIISYTHKSPTTIGGFVEFTVSKEKCIIIETSIFQ
ncbi:MAG: hypothetical protein V4642_10515 [Bacteroidota bacterium]